MVILSSAPSLTTINGVAFLVPSILIVTILGLTYRVKNLKKKPPVIPRKLNFHEDSEHIENQDRIPQGLIHVNQVDLEKFRDELISEAGDVIGQHLQRVGQALSQDQEQECHPLEEEAKALGIEVIFVKPKKHVEEDMEVAPKLNDELNEIIVQANVHQQELCSESTLKDDDFEDNEEAGQNPQNNDTNKDNIDISVRKNDPSDLSETEVILDPRILLKDERNCLSCGKLLTNL